jgi:hypothetical protein
VRARRNGSITAHGREWPLYELEESGVMRLLMSPQDQEDKYELDNQALLEDLKYRRKGFFEYYGGTYTNAAGEMVI